MGNAKWARMDHGGRRWMTMAVGEAEVKQDRASRRTEDGSVAARHPKP